MASWHDVGFKIPPNVPRHVVAHLEGTFRCFDYDFPGLYGEATWRGPQCDLVDILDFSTLVAGEPIAGWSRQQWEAEDRYRGAPSEEKMGARPTDENRGDCWLTGIPQLPKHGNTAKEFVLHYVDMSTGSISKTQYDLLSSLVTKAFGDETLTNFQNLVEFKNSYILDEDKIHSMLSRLTYGE